MREDVCRIALGCIIAMNAEKMSFVNMIQFTQHLQKAGWENENPTSVFFDNVIQKFNERYELKLVLPNDLGDGVTYVPPK